VSIGFRRDQRGAAAVELALLSPILCILFLGTVEVTQLIRVKTKMVLAAQAIQTMVTAQSTATSSSLTLDYTGGQAVMTPFSGSALAVTIVSVGFSSSGSASSVIWQVVEGGGTGMSTATACTAAAQTSLGSDSVIVVYATYSYKPVLSYLLGSSYLLTQTAYGRPRNVSSISGPPSTGPIGSC
jgi:Flp pilus assembly protein TadG